MLTIVPQTHKQKVKMYMKSKKKELAKMLANRDMYEMPGLRETWQTVHNGLQWPASNSGG